MNELQNMRAPLLHSGESALSRARDRLLALLPAWLAGIYFFGPKVLLLTAVSLAACALGEAALAALLRRGLTLTDGSFAVTALLLVLGLPAGVPWWAPAAGALASVLAGQLTGRRGLGRLHPALTGLCVLWFVPGLCPPDAQLEALLAGQLPVTTPLRLFIGQPVGCIGTGSPLLLLLGGLYLASRGLLRPWLTLSFGLTALLGFWCFPAGGGRLPFTAVSLCTGLLVFTGVHLLGQEPTAPLYRPGQLLLGVLLGALTVAGRRLLGVECVQLAALLAGPLAQPLDRLFLPRPARPIRPAGAAQPPEILWVQKGEP